MVNTKVPEDLNKQVALLRDWIERQGHLPKNLDDRMLIRFLHSNYYDMDKARSTAELFFGIRTSAPEILTDRDPLSPAIQKSMKIVNLAQYQVKGKNFWIWQLNDPGLDNYDYVIDAKLFFLVSDAWLMQEQELEESDIVILDVKDLSLKFITKFNVSVARKLSKYQEEAMPVRIKQIHIINSPPVIDKLYGLLKPMLKPEMTDLIKFHSPNSTTLFDYLSKDELPEDFGGTQGKLEDHTKKCYDLMYNKRDLLIDENLWKSEKKAKNKDFSTDIGSFRTLAID